MVQFNNIAEQGYAAPGGGRIYLKAGSPGEDPNRLIPDEPAN